MFILDDPMLAGFKDRLDNCITRDERDAAVYSLIFSLIAIHVAASNPTCEESDRLDQFMQLLQRSPISRKSGRPTANREAEEDGKLFQLLKPKTPAEGARLLMRPLPNSVAQFSNMPPKYVESMQLLLRILSGGVTDEQARAMKYDAALKRAKRARYLFPAKGRPFGG